MQQVSLGNMVFEVEGVKQPLPLKAHLYFFSNSCNICIGLYWAGAGYSSVSLRSIAMGKDRQSKKEAKKQAIKTPKEKKVAKQAKKHAADIAPLITR